MAKKYSCLEHELMPLPITGHIDGISFPGPPENRTAPEYLGVSLTQEGLRAHYYIGTSWLKEGESYLSIEPKLNGRNCPRIDFGKMFSEALQVGSRHDADYFGTCYGISMDEKGIDAGNMARDFLLLLALHYVSVLKFIITSGLRKGYVTVEENLSSKVRGRIMVPRNISLNDMNQRPDRVYCSYQIYTEDIPENRLLKKALLATERLVQLVPSMRNTVEGVLRDISKLKAAFFNVSSSVDEHSVRGNKSSKLFRNYKSGLRIARMILRQEAYGMDAGRNVLPPFWIDMTGIFELYALSMLERAYPSRILFQVPASHKTRCDYLDRTAGIIMDAKYKPGYSFREEDSKLYGLMDDIREISGYARDRKLLRIMGKDNYIPPCVVIYPDQKDGMSEFSGQDLIGCCEPIEEFASFYRVGIKLPTMQ